MKSLKSLLGLSAGKQQTPVICMLCSQPVRKELEVLKSCEHVFCAQCYSPYSKLPPLITPASHETGQDNGQVAERENRQETGRVAGRETGRETGRVAGRETGRETGRVAGRETGRETGQADNSRGETNTTNYQHVRMKKKYTGYEESKIYCPVCLAIVSRSSYSSKPTTKLPSRLKQLVDSVSSGLCSHHPKQPISTVCIPCNEACCAVCITQESRHKGHRLVSHAQDEEEDVFKIEELLQRLNAREMLKVQVERLEHEQNEAVKRCKASIQAHTRAQINSVQQKEARLFAEVEAHHKTVKESVKCLQKLLEHMLEATTEHIKYLHALQQGQPKRQQELLVNYSALSTRTQTLLIMSLDNTLQNYHLTEDVYMQNVRQFPTFRAAGGQIEFNQRPLPSVSHVETTLSSILHLHDDDTSEAETDDRRTYWLKDNPPIIAEPYTSVQSVEPGSVVFLPDQRLVVTEQKGHRISIWKAGYEDMEYDITSPGQIFPSGITYWQSQDLFAFTCLRHRTIGFVESNGDNMKLLPQDLTRCPKGIAIHPCGYILVTNSDPRNTDVAVQMIDPHKVEIIRSYHHHGKPTWITTLPDRRVLVSDRFSNSVFIYDDAGNRLSEIPVQNPEQVIVDPEGRSLLIATTGSHESSVLLYDLRQLKKRKEVLSVRDRLMCPSSIAIGRDGQLAVVQRTGEVRVYGLYDYR